MQEDLLAELHLPKVNFKSFQDIVTHNSDRLACLIKGKNKYEGKFKSLKPGFKVIVGAPDYSDSKPSLSPSRGKTKAIKRKIIFKKILCPTEYNFNNGLEKPLLSAFRTCPNILSNSVHEARNRENGKTNFVEFRPLIKRNLLNSKFSSKEPGLSANRENSSNVCIETKCFRDIIANKPSEEKADVEIVLDTNEKSSDDCNRSLLKQSVSLPEPENAVARTPSVAETTSETGGESKPFCVISKVVGNADTTFPVVEEPQGSEPPEPQLITPKKTNDITKIKGWRRKQFFVEKPTTVEYYSVSKGSRAVKKKIDLDKKIDKIELTEEPGNKETAFFCDSLDEFLDREADLKIGYEIPHLYAEFGIKLTKDEIVSRPNLPEKEIVEIETRYCRPITLPSDNSNLDDIKEVDFCGLKRSLEHDSKPSKILKVNESRRRKADLKENLKSDCTKDNLKPKKCDLNNIKLLSKLIAVVVYPGPYVPLHPLVQYHLDKLRSYRTVVDKRWAEFATSAVLVNKKRLKRQILPAYCCVKVDKNLSTEVEKEKNEKKKEIKIKPCSVVIKKLDCPLAFNAWCMDHNCYNCAPCGLVRGELFTQKISPRESFNRKISRLLAKKVRLLRTNGDTLTSIDCLKVLQRDTIEFIKLKFVKESFLTGYINIWYLRPQTNGTRSRAFLTFSKSSPVQNAVNLRSTGLSTENLPKVITEIVSTENTFDSNDYAILHCNGGIWEIHGSLNISFGNSEKNVKQIFTSIELPELKKLQEIAFEILHVEAVKWWVLDLTQKFEMIELKSGNMSTVVSRKKFFETITLNSFGFLPLKKDKENRVVGAYLIQRLLPFVLIGPYYLLETQDMILKGMSSTVPFRYYGEENVTTNYPLKFFINSVIKNLKMNQCKLEGLWLYDKMCLDRTSYIEIVTGNSEEILLPNRFSSIEIEHGYSLNSLTYTSPSGAAFGIVKRRDGKSELQTVTVYLYFEIFDLGFVEGELQVDNSVIINHPLDERTKVKSHEVGDWFISIIKQRVQFVPTYMEVKWFITKHKNDLNGRLPFNKFVLGGAHVLTKDGILNVMEMTESEMEKLGPQKNEIVKAVSDCEELKEEQTIWPICLLTTCTKL